MATEIQEVSAPEQFDRSLAETTNRKLIAGMSPKGVKAGRLLSEVQKTSVSYNANTQYVHGPSGFLNQPGVDQALFSTIYRPMGVSRILPVVPTQVVTPIFEVLTSQSADSGSEPSDDCSNPIISGKLSVAALTAPFGKITRATDTITVSRPGQIVNRADPLDLRVVNDMTTLSPFVPDPARNNPEFINSELGAHLWKLGLSHERKIEGMMFTGAVANNVGTGYAEFVGYDTLINTGHIDLLTGGLVPALDSLIVNWNSGNISGTVSLNGGNWNFVQTMSAVAGFLYNKALRTGMLPVEWAIAMRYDAFWEATYIWPCSYLTNGCTVTSGTSTQFVAATDQVSMRDQMRTGQFLWINGMRYPVIITDAISETAGGGFSRSGVYFLPISAGGFNVNYLQYYDFTNQQINQVMDLPVGNRYWTSNAGLYLWTYTNNGYCVQLQAQCQPRMILRTPWLAARIQNVGYQTAIHTNDAFTSALYAAPGGGTQVGNYNPAALYPTAV